MSEVSLWEALRGLLPRGQYSRIESGDTAPGFPDVQYQLRSPNDLRSQGVSGTIELKDSKHRTGVPFRNEDEGLHLSQKIWIGENTSHGGICWIVARVLSKVYWINGGYAMYFNGCDNLSRLATHVMDMRKVTADDTKGINAMLRGMRK